MAAFKQQREARHGSPHCIDDCGLRHSIDDCRRAIRQLEAQRRPVLRMENRPHRAEALRALETAIRQKKRTLERVRSEQ
jgi:hypothetical protein